MSTRATLLGDFLEELCAATDFTERFDVYARYITALGFDGASFTYVPSLFVSNHIHVSPIFHVTEHYPQAFIEQYNNEHWEQYDFTITELNKNNFAIKDWQQAYASQALTAAAKQQLLIAKTDYDIKNALTIPLKNFAGVSGTSIISHEKNRSFNKLKKEHLETLRILTRVFSESNFADSAIATYFVAPYLSVLKKKELAVLQYIAAGKALKNIETELGITKRYASNLLDLVRERLGGISRDQLMCLFGEYRILDPKRGSSC